MRTSLKSWTKGIKGRLLIASVFPFIAFAIMFGFTYSGLGTLSALLQSAHHDIIPNISSLDDIRIAQNRFGYRMWEGLINPEDRKETLPECIESMASFKEAFKKYTDSPFAPEETVLFNDVKETFPAYVSLAESIIADVQTGTPESVKRAQFNLDEKLHPLHIKLEEFNEKVTAFYDKRASAEFKEFHEAKQRILTMMVLVTLFSGFSIMGLLMMTAGKVSNTVGGIAEQLTQASEQVAGAVSQLNQAGNGLSESSTQSAASLEETAASLEELSSMVKMNSDNANQAATLAHSSRDSADQGEKEIKSLIQAMSDISDSSKKIEEIISVIDDIAFQTNLLALNAAVEAARAGEQGKGFAVVAEAVRALAQRSASSAKDISGLIKSSVERVTQGSRIADSSGAVLGRIVQSITQVSDLNNKIATASAEQTSGLAQISKAMNLLDQSAQSNAASAEEIAATSGEISNLAQTSESLSKELNVVVLGASEGQPHHQTTHVAPVRTATTRAHKKAA